MAYRASWTFLSRMRSAMSLPHNFVWSEPVGTMIFETPTKLPPCVICVCVVTRKLLAGRVPPNTEVEQSIWTDVDPATQWRAVATRFGARRAPEQNETWLPI